MGVDLTLLPLLNKDFWASHQVVQLERRRELWDPIIELPQRDVPKPLSCYLALLPNGERGYGVLTEDPYGGSLKWTTPEDLLKLRNREEVQDNWQNRAVWAWLAELPLDWPIVLYWH